MYASLSLKPQRVVATGCLYLAAVLPHANGDLSTTITWLQMQLSVRTLCSGCLLHTYYLQLSARSSSCGPNLFPNRGRGISAVPSILGNVDTLRIAPTLITLPAVRVRHDAPFFLGVRGAAVSGQTACGVTKQ